MDVALIQWPSDEALRLELARLNQPRLLLVDPDADPPEVLDVLEDWVRLPVSRLDRTARVRTLEARADDDSPPIPLLGPDGTLEFRGASTQLSEVQTRLALPLVEHFGLVVSRDTLIARTWPGDDVSANNLEVTVGRLRRQMSALGLQIRTVRSRGYLLRPADTV